ncbi:alkaline phosphatase PafA [Pontibacter akesuensis]|uniref:Type I phosphodiesterase / nucleotide pyrophosphatase n=1 Tax=Pontibacter akesuensis TaxID=388950 RepID=A0A1I7IA69_9BACT|nr:alkaline phosphatase PafA [Pontibacter akesuensis]GHA66010.1 alkaline phosphatase family protein [Pontibacter akesuensis]SFU69829.1 Type I phosphodiesterase / nucleotide pyrophosphatase [Pontibacter akesuensis]
MINIHQLKQSVWIKAAACCLLILSACASATTPTASTGTAAVATASLDPIANRPKLVVGIVVDQMRYDYLYRYWSKYGNEGFKKLLAQGFNFKNTQYSYVPTYTGPGHASIYTGSVPAINGIVGNSWYERDQKATMYCVEDKSVQTVGSTSTAGQMSPENLKTTTITDELKLATNMGAKVVGVALKDRGSILPAGHLANGAYWFDSESGNWITSTFYKEQLPAWVQAFNERKLADKYLSEPWETLLPIAQYTESTADDVSWEGTLSGEEKPVFPHNIPAMRGDDFELLRSIPAGNTFTKDFALAALQAEELGKDEVTDFLTISFSTPDYVGHTFGPNSIEAEDVFLRLDKEMAELISKIENEVGKGEVLFFLTSDHGAAHVPDYLASLKAPSGLAVSKTVRDSTDLFLDELYGKGDWVERYMNQQIYLNRSLIESKKLSLEDVQQRVADYVLRFDGVMRTVTASKIQGGNWGAGMMARVENGYNARRSGDVILLLEPGWFEGYNGRTGTTHGSYSNYDTHVPLVWYGWKVQPGESDAAVAVSDIAATLAAWLYIQEPNGSIGQPLQVYMK